MKRWLPILGLLLWSAQAFAQAPTMLKAPDCQFPFKFTTATPTGADSVLMPGSTASYDNRGLQFPGPPVCTTWTLSYQVSGSISAISVQFNGAGDNNGQAGSYSVWPTPISTLPLTTVGSAQVTGYGFQPWLNVQVNSVTGTGQVSGTLSGWAPAFVVYGDTLQPIKSTDIAYVEIVPGSTPPLGVGVSTYSTTGGLTVTTIASGAHQVYGLAVDSGANTADTWVNIYDSTSAVAGSTTPKMAFKIPGGTSPTGGGNNPQIPVMGVPVTTGLQWFCSITSAGNASAAPVACGITLFYK